MSDDPIRDREVLEIKSLRARIAETLRLLYRLPASRERALAYTKLQEGNMWLGMDLGRMREPNPYPANRDLTSPAIDPPAPELRPPPSPP